MYLCSMGMVLIACGRSPCSSPVPCCCHTQQLHGVLVPWYGIAHMSASCNRNNPAIRIYAATIQEDRPSA